MKLQLGMISELIDNYKEAVKMMYRSGGNEEEWNELTDGNDHAPLSMAHPLANNERKRSEESETFINCDLVLGSVSEVVQSPNACWLMDEKVWHF